MHTPDWNSRELREATGATILETTETTECERLNARIIPLERELKALKDKEASDGPFTPAEAHRTMELEAELQPLQERLAYLIFDAMAGC